MFTPTSEYKRVYILDFRENVWFLLWNVKLCSLLLSLVNIIRLFDQTALDRPQLESHVIS